MGREEIFANLKAAVIGGDQELCRQGAQDALDAGIAPLEAVDHGLSQGMKIVGDRFENGDSFLPELLMAADAFTAAMEILNPAIAAMKQNIRKEGTVVLATVKGDVHSIGKNIVATVMETNGFEVVDLGVDQPTLNIIETAEKSRADVIALSSVMTTTMPGQKEIIDTLAEMKKRNNFFVLVGGGPVSQQWADEIGADGYGKTAVEAVELAKNLIKKRQQD